MIDKDTIQKVWEKGRIIEGYSADLIRKDCCGAWMMRNEYGSQNSKYGWVIDHAYPVSLGGDDNIDNLRPMHWENNQSKSDDFPTYIAIVKAEGNSNEYIKTQYTINDTLLNTLKQIYKL